MSLIINPTEGGHFKEELTKISDMFKATHNMGIKIQEGRKKVR
jgi:hypothetical protein